MTPRDLTPDVLLSTTRAVGKRLDLSRPVERDLIEECLDFAFQAPTGGNLQGWHFVLVTEPSCKKALAGLYRKSKRENDPPSVPPEHQRIMDASALAEPLQPGDQQPAGGQGHRHPRRERQQPGARGHHLPAGPPARQPVARYRQTRAGHGTRLLTAETAGCARRLARRAARQARAGAAAG